MIAMNVSGDNLDRGFWTAWSSSPELDRARLREGIMGLTQRLDQAVREDDWETVRDCRMLYSLGEPYCAEEPYRSEYEYGKAMMSGFVAVAHCSDCNYKSALDEAGSVLQLLAAGDARREELGLPAQTNYSPRVVAYHALGSVKWLGPAELRDEVLAPDDLIDDLAHVSDGAHQAIATGQAPQNINKRVVLDGLALAEIEVCKAAVRWCPTKVGSTVARFNRRYGTHLAAATGDFRRHGAPEALSAYYWDFELAKLYLTGKFTPEEVYMCMELRAASARDTFGDWPLAALYRNWRNQGRRMLADGSGPTQSA